MITNIKYVRANLKARIFRKWPKRYLAAYRNIVVPEPWTAKLVPSRVADVGERAGQRAAELRRV
jgi:hypothetical protein